MSADKIVESYKAQLLDNNIDAERKRLIFADLSEQLRKGGFSTFYINYPGTRLAQILYRIATKITKGTPPTAGDIWKTLIPTLQNTTQITLDELPGYDSRVSLILTDDNHLVTVAELAATKQGNSRVGLSNPYKTAKERALTLAEKEQLKLKNEKLWQQYYGDKPWMSQQTYERIVFVLNITVSKKYHPDGITDVLEPEGTRETFLIRFENGLTANSDFRKCFEHYLNNHGDNIAADYNREPSSEYNAEQNLKLSFCFAYLINYIDTLPAEEQKAFHLIGLNENSKNFQSLISNFHSGGCASIVSDSMSDIIVALTIPENKSKLKYQLRRNYKKSEESEESAGSLRHFVITSTLLERLKYKVKSFAWQRFAFVTILSLGSYPIFLALEWLAVKAVDFSLGTARRITAQLFLWMLLSFRFFRTIFEKIRDNYYDFNKRKKYFYLTMLVITSVFIFVAWSVYTSVRVLEKMIFAILSPYHTYCKVRFHAFTLVNNICNFIFSEKDRSQIIYPWVKYASLVIMATAYLTLIIFAAPAAAGLLAAILGASKSIFLADFLGKISAIPFIGQIFPVIGNFLANSIITPILNYFSVSAIPELVAGLATLVSIIVTCQVAQLIYKAVATIRCSLGIPAPSPSNPILINNDEAINDRDQIQN